MLLALTALALAAPLTPWPLDPPPGRASATFAYTTATAMEAFHYQSWTPSPPRAWQPTAQLGLGVTLDYEGGAGWNQAEAALRVASPAWGHEGATIWAAGGRIYALPGAQTLSPTLELGGQGAQGAWRWRAEAAWSPEWRWSDDTWSRGVLHGTLAPEHALQPGQLHVFMELDPGLRMDTGEVRLRVVPGVWWHPPGKRAAWTAGLLTDPLSPGAPLVVALGASAQPHAQPPHAPRAP